MGISIFVLYFSVIVVKFKWNVLFFFSLKIHAEAEEMQRLRSPFKLKFVTPNRVKQPTHCRILWNHLWNCVCARKNMCLCVNSIALHYFYWVEYVYFSICYTTHTSTQLKYISELLLMGASPNARSRTHTRLMYSYAVKETTSCAHTHCLSE